MWNKLFKSKSKLSGNKSKLSSVVKGFSLRKNSKANDANNPIASNAVATLNNATNADIQDSPPVEEEEFESCPICSRKFNPETYKKHVRICQKTTTKKRKPFDSYRQRREGTDLASFLPKNFGLPASKHTQPEIKSQPQPQVQPKPVVESVSPRRASEPVIKSTPVSKIETSLRVAKRLQASISEECPYCKRSFGTKAYDRHVEWCREKARIAPQKSQTANVAKVRLEARTKYRAPCQKSKRELNREKYSGLSCSESTNSLSDVGITGRHRSHSQSEERERKISLSTSMTSSMTSDGKIDDDWLNLCMSAVQLDLLENTITNEEINPVSCSNRSICSNKKFLKKSNQSEKCLKLNRFIGVQKKVAQSPRNKKKKSRLKTPFSYTKKYSLLNDSSLIKNHDPIKSTSKSESNPCISLSTKLINCKKMEKLKLSQSFDRFGSGKEIQHNSSTNLKFLGVEDRVYVKQKSKILLNSSTEENKAFNTRRINFTRKKSQSSFENSKTISKHTQSIIPIINTFQNINIQTRGLSDKYDPFLSAKRQLEELFPPVNIATSTPKPNNRTNLMSTSLNFNSSLKSPTTPTSTNTNKTNFRRSSSLRVSKKTTKPVYSPIYLKTTPTTIHRGISDEGPISTNFMKPEEYDELPVKSHAIITPELVPKSPRESPRVSPQQSAVIKRDNSASTNRRNLRLDIKQPNTPASDFSLTKTDSLAAFLKYEHDLNCTPSLTEKERKDKSNSLNKQTSSKTVLSSMLSSHKNDVTKEKPDITDHYFTARKYSSIKLAPLDKNFQLNSILSIPHSEYENTYIDPKLINICDNLSVGRISDKQLDAAKQSRSKESGLDTLEMDSNKAQSQRSSEERRFFKRQLKLNKENFLYDSCSADRELMRDGSGRSLKSDIDDQKKTLNDKIDTLFNDFDFDEFITSFDDDEQYPIFKDYKERLLNRAKIIKREISDSSNSSDASLTEEKTSNQNIQQKDDQQHFHLPNDNEIATVTNSNSQPSFSEVPFRDYVEQNTQAERDLQKTLDDLDQICTSEVNMYPADSDELSSGDNSYSVRTATTKLSADSAYGSLSRHSPLERPTRRNITRRQPIPDVICNKLITTKTTNKSDQPKKFNSPDSLSSSGSESSLPPITSQKIEIHAQSTKEPRLSKFCHACGNRFTYTEAKFCMECGTRRITA